MTDDRLKTCFPPEHLKLHHVGFAVRSIQESAQAFVLALGISWDENIIHDPIQKVRVAFLGRVNGTEALIELVEPAGADSPVSRFIEQGGGLHHLCYEVAHLDDYLASCKAAGISVIHTPVPAVAFGGRRIAWCVVNRRLLVELLEGQEALPSEALSREGEGYAMPSAQR